MPMQNRSPQAVGLASADWCPYGIGHDMPGDQRIDDGRSLCFDTELLENRLEFLGAPEVAFDVAVDRPSAFLVLRLCDVAPTGESVLITYGALNLTHRNGHDRFEPLQPGKRYPIKMALNNVGYAVAAGHRLRLAISTAYWPVIWPSPEPVTLTIFAGEGSVLTLPIRAPRAEDAKLPEFQPPEQGPTVPHSVLRMPRRGRMTVTQDAQTGEYRIHSMRDRAAYRLHDIDLDHSSSGEEIHTIHPDDPLAARSETFRSVSYARGDWKIKVDTHTVLTATREHFVVTSELDAFDGTERVVTRRWNKQIPRKGV
jgi:predicted acyl esterase